MPLLDDMEASTPLLRACHAAFDWWERWAASRAGIGLMLVWALAEAIVWPIFPDFLLIPMAVGNRRRFYVPLAAAVIGMALGGTLTFLFALWAPHQAWDVLRHIPLIHSWEINAVRSRLATQGVAAFLFQPWSGIPFKVFAVVGGVQGLSPWLVIPTFIAARGARMAILATLARLLAGRFARFVRDYSILVAALYLSLFFYIWW